MLAVGELSDANRRTGERQLPLRDIWRSTYIPEEDVSVALSPHVSNRWLGDLGRVKRDELAHTSLSGVARDVGSVFEDHHARRERRT